MPAEGARLFVLPGDRRLLLVALPLEVLGHDLGTVGKGRCPASSAGRLRVREPKAGSSWRDAGRARCLGDALSPAASDGELGAGARQPGSRARATAS